MNKVLHINLGGYPFTIDEDAYEHLNRYLNVIHRHFRASEGYEEITQDIEARLAELFQDHLGNRPIVNRKDVEAAIAVMGRPEEFGAEPMAEAEAAASGGSQKSGYKTGKRLFRDPDESVVGGVCAGMSAYLGISDPLWVRLAFIVFTVSGGFGVPLYVILWAVLPKAETAGDRLAMRGEPINVSNIGRIIEEELQRFGDKVSELGGELSAKKKSFSTGGDRSNPLAQGIYVLGYLIRTVIDMLAQLWRPLLMIVGLALIIAFAVAWISSIIGIFYGLPFIDYIAPGHRAGVMLGAFNLLFLVTIPLAGLLMLVSRLLFRNHRVSRRWSTGLAVVWSINLISLIALGSLLGRQFAREVQTDDAIALPAISSDTLYLRVADEPLRREAWFNLDGDVWFTDRALVYEGVRLHIRPSADSSFHLLRTAYARGEQHDAANALARQISYDVRPAGDTLELPAHLILPQGSPWRAQRLDLTLEVPVHKNVFLSASVEDLLDNAELSERGVSPWRYTNRNWRMDEGGLTCLTCGE